MLLADFAHSYRWAAVNQGELRSKLVMSVVVARGSYLNLVCDNLDSGGQHLLQSQCVKVTKTKQPHSIIVL